MEERSASSNRGFLILSVAGILSKVISVFYIPLLQRIIGLDGYGIYQNCYEVFLFVYAVTNLGTQPAIAKVVAELTALEKPNDAIRALKISRTLLALAGAILTIFLMIFAFPIGKAIGNPSASYGILMLAPSIFVTSLLSSYRGYFQGRNSMTAIAVSQVLEQVINIVISLACAYILMKVSVEYGSAGGTVGTSIGALIACLYMVYIYGKNNFEEEAIEAQHNNNTKRVRTKHIIRKLIKYGLPITLSSGLQNFGSLVDMVNVNSRLAFAGFTAEQSHVLYGVLGRYKTLLSVPLIIVTALGTTVLPAVAAAMALKDKKEVRRKTTFAFRITFIITIPAAVGLACLAQEVFELLYGTTQGFELMVWGSVVLILMAVVSIQTVILQSMNKLYFVLGTFSIGIIAKIVANYILVGMPDINILGVVVGNFLWFAIPFILNQRALKKALRVKIPMLRNIIKPLAASIVMAGTILAIRVPVSEILIITNQNIIIKGISTLIMISAGGFVYLYLMVLLGGIIKSDIASVSSRIFTYLPRFLRKKLK
ncbi:MULTISPECIES: polysaccharide biosynthesis protein [unclassified Clostridium]|uniref:putative polysaccharide biosynthesis protein n=1 Tax=unclassified Clostridium TaxID=2614128 RepID=UPI0002972D49|nr:MULTISPECIES: polysaccharide biosynthesis protein [unclassified Clostridium]EKQ53170.1 MAG: membrane protein involved in the export of O-antigen and teichoic acid [Clostridium sp. Maddingley MBC34-26]